MSDHEKTFTAQQSLIISEFVAAYGLSPEQISFEFDKPEPIFDFEALCVLREKLTNFKEIDVSYVHFNNEKREAEAVCQVTQHNGNKIKISDFAKINELMPDGSRVESELQAKRLARARAMRTGIRAAGINLLKAHQHYIETNSILEFTPVNPRIAMIKEIHLLAENLGYIVKTDKGKDKRGYAKFIAEIYEGRMSTDDLDDLECQRLRVTFRAMLRVKNAGVKHAA